MWPRRGGKGRQAVGQANEGACPGASFPAYRAAGGSREWVFVVLVLGLGAEPGVAGVVAGRRSCRGQRSAA